MRRPKYGGVPEWPKGTDCKSVGSAFGGSNPPPSTIFQYAESSWHTVLVLEAHVAQLVERILGKDEVTGSNPVVGSTTAALTFSVPSQDVMLCFQKMQDFGLLLTCHLPERGSSSHLL